MPASARPESPRDGALLADTSPPRAVNPDAGKPRLRSSRYAVLALAALCIPLFFLGMGRMALIDPDEPYYAVPALEMLHAGTWSVPLFHGRPWFDKPILFYWMVLGAYRLLGATELAARLGSGLAALSGVLALFFYARRRPGANGAPVLLTALLPALVLATSLEYALLARFAVTDMTLTLFLTLGMIASALYLEAGKARWTALAGVAFGLALLTKGPVGVFLPILALAAWTALARRTDFLRPAAWAAAGLGAALTAGPWYAYMAIAHRALLVDTFLGQGNLGRFLEPEHRTNPLFYLAVLAVGLLPWSGALPFALVEGGRRARGGFAAARASLPGGGDREASIRARASVSPLFELCWFGAVIFLFSLSASRLLTYILPAFPPAALLIGDYWSGRLQGAGRATEARRGPAWVLPALIGVPCALVLMVGARAEAASEWVSDTRMLTALGVLLGAASIGASLVARTGRARPFLAAQAATSILVVLFIVGLVAPQAERLRSARPLALELKRRGLDADVIGAVHERDFSLDFYLGRTLPRVTGRLALQAAVAEHPGRLWVVPRSQMAEVIGNRRLHATWIAESATSTALRLSPAAAVAGAPDPSAVSVPASAQAEPGPRLTPPPPEYPASPERPPR